MIKSNSRVFSDTENESRFAIPPQDFPGVGDYPPRPTRAKNRRFRENPSASSGQSPVSDAKVLFVICNLDRGGTETQVVEIALRMASTRYRVTVAALQGAGPLRAKL
jgi:hypothetical protein